MWKLSSFIRLFFMGGFSLLVIGCAPPVYNVQRTSAPPPALPSVTLYFYPNKGQSPEQQERDRYECYQWAVKQTGYDPGRAQLAPHQRIEVRSATPPGSDTAAGAVAGAVIGSMLSPRHDRGQGLVFGAITGAIMGSASEQAKQEQAARMEQQYNANMDAQQYAKLEQQAREYRRAMTACLEGRNYTVR